MAGWRAVLEARGVRILEECRVAGVAGESGTVRALNTSQGPLSADAFVFAIGAWTPLLNEHLGCKIPIQPGKGYSLTMPRPAVCPKYPLLLEEDRVAVTPMQSGLSPRLDDGIRRIRRDVESQAIELAAPRREPLFARALLRAGAGIVVRMAADDLRQPADHRPQSGLVERLDRRRPQHARPVDGPGNRPADRRTGRRPTAASRRASVQRKAVLTKCPQDPAGQSARDQRGFIDALGLDSHTEEGCLL